eukprot:94451-Prymnesium_polylepis.1
MGGEGGEEGGRGGGGVAGGSGGGRGGDGGCAGDGGGGGGGPCIARSPVDVTWTSQRGRTVAKRVDRCEHSGVHEQSAKSGPLSDNCSVRRSDARVGRRPICRRSSS